MRTTPITTLIQRQMLTTLSQVDVIRLSLMRAHITVGNICQAVSLEPGRREQMPMSRVPLNFITLGAPLRT